MMFSLSSRKNTLDHRSMRLIATAGLFSLFLLCGTIPSFAKTLSPLFANPEISTSDDQTTVIVNDAPEQEVIVIGKSVVVNKNAKGVLAVGGDVVVEEARQLAEQGVKEIVLIAQDSSRYGEDLGEVDALAALIRALGEIDGIEWIRPMYAFPTHISDAFLAAIAETPKAVKYLDMPLQHASRNVLKLMKRGGTRDSLERLIGRVRDAVPGIAIRTTFITGFPGETEEDFEELIKFVQNCRFENLGVFTYSDEEGTAAYELPNKVDPKVAMQRRNRLMKEQAKISKQLNKSRIGNTYKVMFEGLSQESDLLFQGRLEGQTQEIDGYILINDMPDDFEPQIGAIYDVKITEAHAYDLVGEIV